MFMAVIWSLLSMLFLSQTGMGGVPRAAWLSLALFCGAITMFLVAYLAWYVTVSGQVWTSCAMILHLSLWSTVTLATLFSYDSMEERPWEGEKFWH
jgi:hypothetical protein